MSINEFRKLLLLPRSTDIVHSEFRVPNFKSKQNQVSTFKHLGLEVQSSEFDDR